MTVQKPEIKLLLALLRTERPDSITGVNFKHLLRLMVRHRLLTLSKEITGNLSNLDREKLQMVCKRWSIKSIELTRAMIRVLIELQKNHINAITLKGPVLAITIYKGLNNRHFNDIDILVPQKELPETIKVLENMGYQLRYPRKNLSDKQWNYYVKHRKDIGWSLNHDSLFLELHVSLVNPGFSKVIEKELLYEDAMTLHINNTPIYTLGIQATFLYLVYHGAIHQYMRLFWLRDIFLLIQREDINHSYIIKFALDHGFGRMLGVSLLLIRDYLKISIPDEYSIFLLKNAGILTRLKKMCITRIEGPEELTIVGKFNRMKYLMILKPGMKYKWSVISGIFHRWYIRKFLGGH